MTGVVVTYVDTASGDMSTSFAVSVSAAGAVAVAAVVASAVAVVEVVAFHSRKRHIIATARSCGPLIERTAMTAVGAVVATVSHAAPAASAVSMA